MGNSNCHSVKDGSIKKTNTSVTDEPIKPKRRVTSFLRSPIHPAPSETILVMAAAGSQIMMASQKIACCNLGKYAKHLAQLSFKDLTGISKGTFQTEVFPHSSIVANYFWNFFAEYEDEKAFKISEKQFTQAAEQVYAQITDKEQVQFYVKLFAKGTNTIDRHAFADFLLSAYQLDFTAQLITLNPTLTSSGIKDASPNEVTDINNLDGNEWIQAVIQSCFHLKEEVSVFFICKWIEMNLPRILINVHKYITHQLTTGFTQAQAQQTSKEDKKLDLTSPSNETTVTDSSFYEEPIRARIVVNGINPVLLWLLSVSLPNPHAGPLERKPKRIACPFTKFMSPQALLRQLMSQAEEEEPWTELYDSAEQGTSINRFQYNIYNYRGPSLIFIFAENNYTLCIGADQEWKESIHFWGEEDSFIVQLQPEFHIIERGPKLIYTNFSIRGYPFGIQVGPDPKQLSAEIKPDFQYVSFKGIPLRINRMLAFGCGSTQVKSNQTAYKKWENKQCELQRVVKRSKSDWNENPDKYLLELGGVCNSYSPGNT